MRFFETILSAAAFAAAVAALEINEFPSEGVVAGETYTITYSPADDTPTTFILRQGLSTNLDTIDTLTTTATGGSFEWTPSQSLENQPDYALQIQQGETINYSAQFPLTGGAEPEEEPVSSAMSTPVASASKTVSSSATASMTMTSVGSASASVSPSAGLNSTVTSATLSGTATGTASVPEITANSGNSLIASPLAAMFGAAAAFAYLA